MKLKNYIPKKLLVEDTTSTFVVSAKSKNILPIKGNSREYWLPDGKYTGMAACIIEVFAQGDHRHHAAKLYKALDAAGLGDAYFEVSIQVNDKSKKSSSAKAVKKDLFTDEDLAGARIQNKVDRALKQGRYKPEY